MKKPIYLLLATLILAPSLSAAQGYTAPQRHWTFCTNCCNLPADKQRYVNWTYNKMFVQSGTIKSSVDFNSDLISGRGTGPGARRLIVARTFGSNALSTPAPSMTFENEPEWSFRIIRIQGIPIPLYTLTHWNVQSFGFLTLHDDDVTPDDVEFRRRAGGWAVDPIRLPYPANCAADECQGGACEEDEGEGYLSVHFPWGDGAVCSSGSVRDRVLCAINRGFECSCGPPAGHGHFTCVRPSRRDLPLP